MYSVDVLILHTGSPLGQAWHTLGIHGFAELLNAAAGAEHLRFSKLRATVRRSGARTQSLVASTAYVWELYHRRLLQAISSLGAGGLEGNCALPPPKFRVTCQWSRLVGVGVRTAAHLRPGAGSVSSRVG